MKRECEEESKLKKGSLIVSGMKVWGWMLVCLALKKPQTNWNQWLENRSRRDRGKIKRKLFTVSQWMMLHETKTKKISAMALNRLVSVLLMTQREIFREEKITEKLHGHLVRDMKNHFDVFFFFLYWVKTPRIHESCSIFIKTLTTAMTQKPQPSVTCPSALAEKDDEKSLFLFLTTRFRCTSLVPAKTRRKVKKLKNHAINYHENMKKNQWKGNYRWYFFTRELLKGNLLSLSLWKEKGEVRLGKTAKPLKNVFSLDTQKKHWKSSLMSFYTL